MDLNRIVKRAIELDLAVVGMEYPDGKRGFTSFTKVGLELFLIGKMRPEEKMIGPIWRPKKWRLTCR